jgi:hypothetical protein
MDEKVDLVEVLTRRVEELQRGMWWLLPTRLSLVVIYFANQSIVLLVFHVSSATLCSGTIDPAE